MGPSKGPVATDAAEAWPAAPTNVPVISAEDVLKACSIAGACSPEVMQDDVSTRMALVDLCVSDGIFSAERAIPLSGFSNANERVEQWVHCVLDKSNACDLVGDCRTERDSSIGCQEDGCDAPTGVKVSCNGAVAAIEGNGKSVTRDCALAFAQCDTNSPTGCTDRHYTQCPASGSKADRCDGNIRLGCDAFNQVSYHDCTRLGGSCGAAPDGSQDCVYTGTPAPECAGDRIKPSECTGTKLSSCVNGRRLELESALCGAS